MPKINTNYIREGMQKSDEMKEQLSAIPHEEVIPIGYIHPSKSNVFNESDSEESYRELAASIESTGLIHPIAVRQVDAIKYEIVSGERRFRAIKKYLGWKTIRCTVFDGLTDNQFKLKLISANLEVREYSSNDKIRYYEMYRNLLLKMKEDGEFKGAIQKSLSNLLGISERQARKYKTILDKIDDEGKQAVFSGEIGIEEAYEKVAPPEKEAKHEITSSAEDNKNINLDKAQKRAENIPDENIKFAIRSFYRREFVYRYYIEQVPTPQEVSKNLLSKPSVTVSVLPKVELKDGLVILVFGSSGICIQKGDSRVLLNDENIDKYIREMIRNGEWLSPTEQRDFLIGYVQSFNAEEKR